MDVRHEKQTLDSRTRDNLEQYNDERAKGNKDSTYTLTGDFFEDVHHAKMIFDHFELCPGAKIDMDTGVGGFKPFEPILFAASTILKREETNSYSTIAAYGPTAPRAGLEGGFERYCKEEGILRQDQSLNIRDEHSGTRIAIGNGTTQLYSLGINALIKQPGDMILVPTPTYGLFIDQIKLAGGSVGSIPLSSDTDWKVTPDQLEDAIHHYNEQLFQKYKEGIIDQAVVVERKLKRLGINVIRESTITEGINSLEEIQSREEFDEAIKKLNASIQALVSSQKPSLKQDDIPQLPELPRVRGFYQNNPHNPTSAIYERAEVDALAEVILHHPDVMVIDDLSHWNVIYGEKMHANFASSQAQGIEGRVLTLVGISKAYCAGNIRAGICFGPPEWIESIQRGLLASSSNISIFAVDALSAVFSAGKEKRDAYLVPNNKEYKFRRDLMAALINGINTLDISDKRKLRIIEVVTTALRDLGLQPNYQMVDAYLRGINGISTLSMPQASFFHLLDVTPLKGSYIGSHQLLTGVDIRNAFLGLGSVDTIPSELNANFSETLTLRASFSLDHNTIVYGIVNIHNACELMRPYPYKIQDERITPEGDIKEMVSLPVSFKKEKEEEKAKEKEKEEARAEAGENHRALMSRGIALSHLHLILKNLERKLGGETAKGSSIFDFWRDSKVKNIEKIIEHIKKLRNDLLDEKNKGKSVREIIDSFLMDKTWKLDIKKDEFKVIEQIQLIKEVPDRQRQTSQFHV